MGNRITWCLAAVGQYSMARNRTHLAEPPCFYCRGTWRARDLLKFHNIVILCCRSIQLGNNVYFDLCKVGEYETPTYRDKTNGLRKRFNLELQLQRPDSDRKADVCENQPNSRGKAITYVVLGGCASKTFLHSSTNRYTFACWKN